METVLKTTVYLLDMAEFQVMNEVYGTFFPNDPPARVTVQVSKLPAGARVGDRRRRDGPETRRLEPEMRPGPERPRIFPFRSGSDRLDDLAGT